MANIEWASTADACEYAALYGTTPAQIGDPDARLVYDERIALPAINVAMRTLAAVTQAGTRLEDERDGLLWGFVQALSSQRSRLLRSADDVAIKIKAIAEDLGRSASSVDATGMELFDGQLHDHVDNGERLLARSDAFKDLHDQAASVYQDITGQAWRPRRGHKRSGTLFGGAADLDARQYSAALGKQAVLRPGTRIVFSAGVHAVDRAGGVDREWAPAPADIDRAIVAIRDAHPDIVIVTTTREFGDRRLAERATRNGVETEILSDAASLRRACIAGQVHFRCPGSEGNDAEREAVRTAIPVIAIPAHKAGGVDKAEITRLAQAWRPRENPVNELEKFFERLVGAAYKMRTAARDEGTLVGKTPAYAEVMEQLKTLRLHRDLPPKYAAAIDSLVKRSRDEVRNPQEFFAAPKEKTTTAAERRPRNPDAALDRPPPDLAAAIAKVREMFSHLQAATRDGTQLADERAPLLWGVVNAFDHWHNRVAKADSDGHILPVVRQLREAAIAEYDHITATPWRQRAAAKDQEAVTYGQQRGNAFRATLDQLKAPEEHKGPIVAVFGPMLTKDLEDPAHIPTRKAVYEALDPVLAKHPDMAVAITDARGTNDAVRAWAERHDLPVFTARINWGMKKKAPYERNRTLARLPLAGAVHFKHIEAEGGITSNLVDLLQQRRVPIMPVEPAAEIREAAASAAATVAARDAATATLTPEEYAGLLAANIDHRRAQAAADGVGPDAITGYRDTVRTAEKLLAAAQIAEPHRAQLAGAVANYKQDIGDAVAFAAREVAGRVKEPPDRKQADREVRESRQYVQQQQQTQNHARGMRM